MLLSSLKTFLSHNYKLNRATLRGGREGEEEGKEEEEEEEEEEGEGEERRVWPWVVVMSDNCAMWKRRGEGEGAR